MNSATVGVINLGLGNIRSVLNMLSYLNIPAVELKEPVEVREAKRLILPGVGHFDRAIEAIDSNEWKAYITESVYEHSKPILGICLGMQILSIGSEEGSKPGLGFIPAEFKRFDFSPHSSQRVPHMGWNFVKQTCNHPLLNNLDQARFYFVHSYYAYCEQHEIILLTTKYGLEFVSGYAKGLVMGVQFHPEKSHRFGMRLLRNFAEASFS